MALLPGPDDVPAPDFSQMRRQGIGSWNPQVAGQGDQAAARGLESLGSTIGSVSQEIAQSADQVQLAQAHGAAGAALATAHGGLQDITDPSQVLSSDPSKPAPAITDINTKINAAASMISNPIRQAEFKASMLTPVASYTAAALERGRTLNNQTGIASLEQNTTDIINNAATLSDENAAGHALDSIGAQVSALQKAGALNPEQAQKYRQEAVQSFGETRYKYLVGQLEAQPPGQRDYSALIAFTGHMLHGFGAGTDGASVAPGDQSAAPGSPQTGVPLPPARGDGSPPTYAGGAAPSKSPPNVYANIPDVDGKGVAGQVAKFQQWNPDPIGNSAKILATVHPDLQAVVQKAQQENPNLPFVVALGKTTPDQGKLAQSWGWSQTGANSEHNKGTVVDLWPINDKNQVDFNTQKQQQINTAMQKAAGELGLNLRWGGLGSEGGQNKAFRDAPNFQLLNPKPWDASSVPAAPPTGTPGITPISMTGGGITVPSNIAPLISTSAQKWGVDPAMMTRQLSQENGFKTEGRSPAGAEGIAQFIPSTAARYGVNVHDPQSSIEGQAHYMSDLQNMFGGNKGLALAGYNWGEGNVQRWLKNGADPAKLPSETANYVRSITGHNLSDWVQNPGISIHTVPLGPGQHNPTVTVPPGAPNYLPPVIVNNFSSPPTQVASLGPVGLPVQPPIGNLPAGASIDDVDASTSSRAPPSASWPAGAQGVMGNADGSLSFQMKDGSFQPVPGSRATGAPHNGFAAPPAGSVLAAMSPNTRATLQLEGISAIRRMQREDQMANQKDNRGDLASINNTVKAMESGVPIGDQAWASLTGAYSGANVDPQVRYAYAVADNTRRTIQGFKFSSPQDVATAVTNMRAQYAQQINNPATAAQSGVLGETIKSAQNYLSAYEQGVAKDPIGRAAMQGIYGDDPVKPLDPKSPTFSQDFAHRVEQAKTAAKFFNLDQVNYLQPQDKVALRQIASQGGDDMVNLAKGVTAGAGADAPAVFKQIGKEAAPLAQIGQWAMDPNADHSTEIRDYANYIAAASDPKARKDLPRIDNQTLRTQNISNPFQDALSKFSMDDAGRLRGTAFALAGANAPQSTDPKDMDKNALTDLVTNSVNRAVGGTKTLDGANWWGGVAKVGGSYFGGREGKYSTIVPTNMRQDMFESAVSNVNQNDVNQMGPPPIAAGGQKLTASDIQKGKFVAVKDEASGMFGGRYQVQFKDPKDNEFHPAMSADGKPWIFDMNRAQSYMIDGKAAGLDQRYPKAFNSPWHAGGSPSGPIIPPPHNYQNVRGMNVQSAGILSPEAEAQIASDIEPDVASDIGSGSETSEPISE